MRGLTYLLYWRVLRPYRDRKAKDGRENRAPMGVTIIGGLITSSVLTLIVVPVIYTFFDGFTSRVRGLYRKWFGDFQEPLQKPSGSPAAGQA